MTPAEKVAQLLALARSTSFASERARAVGLARTLFNKYRLTDAHLGVFVQPLKKCATVNLRQEGWAAASTPGRAVPGQ